MCSNPRSSTPHQIPLSNPSCAGRCLDLFVHSVVNLCPVKGIRWTMAVIIRLLDQCIMRLCDHYLEEDRCVFIGPSTCLNRMFGVGRISDGLARVRLSKKKLQCRYHISSANDMHMDHTINSIFRIR